MILFKSKIYISKYCTWKVCKTPQKKKKKKCKTNRIKQQMLIVFAFSLDVSQLNIKTVES